MGKKSKCKLTINGQHEILQQIEKMGGEVPQVLKEAIELSGKHATTRYKNVIKEHHYSGITEDSIVQNPKAEIRNGKITMQTGFNIDEGGMPAVWLDRGTPKQKPVRFIQKIKKDKVVTGSIGYVLQMAWRKMFK